MTDRLLPGRDAAAILGCSPRTLENPNSAFSKRLIALDAIVRIGRTKRFRESGIRAVVQGRESQVAA